MYGPANDPGPQMIPARKWSRPANDPGPQMIPVPQMIPKLDRKWSQYRKWSPNWTTNDPKTGNDPQIVPQTIPGTEMVFLPQLKEMSGLRNLDSGFISFIFS